MGLPSRELPATILDHLSLVEPRLARLLPKDAADLAAAGYQPGFMRLEDVPTGFFDEVRAGIDCDIERYARAQRISDKEAAKALWHSARPDQHARYRTLATLYHLALNLELGGTRIFRIAAPLAERLRETSIDVPANELRLPFPSLMLVYDDDVSLNAFHDGQPFGRVPSGGVLSAVLVDVPAIDGKRLLAATAHSKGKQLHGMIHRSMRYGEGSLEGMLVTSWPGDPVRRPDDPGMVFNRLVLNTLLYIVSRDARVSAETKTLGRPDPLVKSARRHRLVGDGLVPLNRSPIMMSDRGTSSSSERQLSSRHVVRGHWKLQPFGGKGGSRRLVWIEPYVRGPQLTELLNRPRLVR